MEQGEKSLANGTPSQYLRQKQNSLSRKWRPRLDEGRTSQLIAYMRNTSGEEENLRSQIWGVLKKVVKIGLINGSRQNSERQGNQKNHMKRHLATPEA